MKKPEQSGERPQLDRPERLQVSPEVNEVLHMLEALQTRCEKEFGSGRTEADFSRAP